MDIITTSGIGTGIEADISKIREMKSIIGYGDKNHNKLAIASGISEFNILNYIDYIDYIDIFFVSSSLESSFGVLDTNKLNRLKNILDIYNK